MLVDCENWFSENREEKKGGGVPPVSYLSLLRVASMRAVVKNCSIIILVVKFI